MLVRPSSMAHRPAAHAAYVQILAAYGDRETAMRMYTRARKRGVHEPLRRYRKRLPAGSDMSTEAVRQRLGWAAGGDDGRVLAAWEEIKSLDAQQAEQDSALALVAGASVHSAVAGAIPSRVPTSHRMMVSL